eukprot:TRINITY_DN10916_c0_g1_i1.p1 TRINITY_DN10916_c0_g1~~TRINITY_DN10916_c0_g1_i1.p1  ORF type:complete len:426 (-),score=126.14 TRINITY_DN10916_c0_g1_i1:134-1411(-)
MSFSKIIVVALLLACCLSVCLADSSSRSPKSLKSKSGSHNGDVSSLKKKEQDGEVTLMPDDSSYSGDFKIKLPKDKLQSKTESVDVKFTFKGPTVNTQEWTASIRYEKDGQTDYLVLGLLNADVTSFTSFNDAEWTVVKFDVDEDMLPFIIGKKVVIRVTSNNADGEAQIDHVKVTWRYSAPTWYLPTPTGNTWQWQLQGKIDTSYDVTMYDIDLFDTDKETIDELHEAGRIVICYFSAGTFEDWRPDAAEFPAAALGAPLGDWEGENWLNIGDIDLLASIMEARLDMAVEKGCDGVEPDNVDGYQNDNGLDLTKSQQYAYNKWLAYQAHSRSLSIALKNALGLVKKLEPHFDWALNEECYQWDECTDLNPFIDNNKAVFQVEYPKADPAEFCPYMNGLKFDSIYKKYSLKAEPRISCDGYASDY